MRKKKVALQELTQLEKRIEELFLKDSIKKADIESFTDIEKDELYKKINEKVKLYEGDNKKLLFFRFTVFACTVMNFC